MASWLPLRVAGRAAKAPIRWADVTKLPSLLTVLVLLWAPNVVSGDNPFEGAKVVFDGFGPVKIGMTVQEFRSVAGPTILEQSPNEGCDYFHIENDIGVSFMISNGRVARVDIDDPHHETLSGVRIGDREATVKRLYAGRYVESPHKYDDDGHYFTIRSRDKRYALVIETNGRHVTYIRCGVVPEPEWVERCL